MKKTLPLIILLCAVCAFSQIKPVEKEQSKLEAFSLRSGTLIEKQFVDVGEIKDVKVQTYILSDLISGIKISGLRLQKTVVDRYSVDTKIAALDLDEIDGLIKSITALKTKIFASTRTSYTEVVYKSRGGFTAGAYFDSGKWTGFLKLEQYDSKSYTYLTPEEFDSFLLLVQKVKEQAQQP